MKLAFKISKSKDQKSNDNNIVFASLGAVCGNDQMMKFYTYDQMADISYLIPRHFWTNDARSMNDYLNSCYSNNESKINNIDEFVEFANAWLDAITFWN